MELSTLSDEDLDFYLKLEFLEGEERLKKAIDQAYRTYKKRVMKFLCDRWSNYNSEERADIVQKTFIELYRNAQIGKIKEDVHLLKALCVIAHSRANDLYRDKKRQTRNEEKYYHAVGNALKDTLVGKQWESAKSIEQRITIEKDFSNFINSLSKTDKIIANAWGTYFPDEPDYEYIGDLIHEQTGIPPTLPAMKSSVQRIRAKYKEIFFKKLTNK
ncbi:MAG: sigma-70 family RNA polymerase sigma factor [Tissierellales bacterium]|nr:sigma-70 family RNA polymerase sigma factor [Tissierellales bacterium]